MKLNCACLKRACSLALAAALSLSLAACGQTAAPASSAPASSAPAQSESAPDEPVSSAEPSESASEAASEASSAITITDHLGRQVTLDAPAERIVSGYYITTSALIALGLADRTVGIEAKADTRPIYSLAAPDLLALPNVGTAKEFNLEGCIALEPDLVILPVKLKDSVAALEEAGITAIGVNPEDQDLLNETIAMIGAAAGVSDRADALIGYAQEKLAFVQQTAAQSPVETTVYFAGNSDFLSTAPAKMYQSWMIETAGGKNAALDIEDTYWATVSYEQVIAYDPDLIVLASDASYTREDVLADPQLAGLKAVQNGAVYQMPGGIEAWDSPVPSGILGVLWMTSLLHDASYPLEQMQADAAAFYEQFYQIEIDTEVIAR